MGEMIRSYFSGRHGKGKGTGTGTADEPMDCTPNMLDQHQRPEDIQCNIEPKRRRLDNDGKEMQWSGRSERLEQLKREILVLEAAVREGHEKLERTLNCEADVAPMDPAVRAKLLSDECRSLMADLNPAECAKAKELEEERIQRCDNGSLMVSLCENGSNPSFVKVEPWELKNCGCDFCGVYSHSRDGLPPRV